MGTPHIVMYVMSHAISQKKNIILNNNKEFHHENG